MNNLRYGYAPIEDGKVIMPVKPTLVEAWEAHPSREVCPVTRYGTGHLLSGKKVSSAWRECTNGFKPKDRETIPYTGNVMLLFNMHPEQKMRMECLGEDYDTHSLD